MSSDRKRHPLLDELARILDAHEPRLREWDRTREALLASTRRLGRLAASLIRDSHRGPLAKSRSQELEAAAEEVLGTVRGAPDLRRSGFVQQALGEYAEARILTGLDADAPLATPRDVAPDALLLGIADAVGELRRRCLDRLIRDDVAGAQESFEQMESLYELLAHADPPESYVALRPKRDQARGILEKTRGDLVNAKKSKDLERRIDGLSDLLDQAENRTPKKPKKAAADDLDLDAAWAKKPR